MTKRNRLQAGFIAILPLLHEAAEQRGYALAVHGTLARDLDLVAVPWIEGASPGDTLIEALRAACGGYILDYQETDGVRTPNPVVKPHGRLGWLIQLGGGVAIDVSVLPIRPTPDQSESLSILANDLRYSSRSGQALK